MCISTYIHIYIYTYIHVYIYTYIQPYICIRWRASIDPAFSLARTPWVHSSQIALDPICPDGTRRGECESGLRSMNMCTWEAEQSDKSKAQVHAWFPVHDFWPDNFSTRVDTRTPQGIQTPPPPRSRHMSITITTHQTCRAQTLSIVHPQAHYIHHTTTIYNYGGSPFWDKLMGTNVRRVGRRAGDFIDIGLTVAMPAATWWVSWKHLRAQTCTN